MAKIGSGMISRRTTASIVFVEGSINTLSPSAMARPIITEIAQDARIQATEGANSSRKTIEKLPRFSIRLATRIASGT
jgi:hypothetical protein